MYIYETHLHTVEASRCGKTPGADYVRYMQDLGYSGFIVTDHFFNGNSSIDRSLPWEEKVLQYVSGYEHALEAAEGTDMKVFFGVEFNFDGDEYLLYGPDRDWLLSHPEVMEMTRTELHEAVRAIGGMMIQEGTSPRSTSSLMTWTERSPSTPPTNRTRTRSDTATPGNSGSS